MNGRSGNSPSAIVTIMGGDYEVYTTAKMSAKEMSEYMDRVFEWAGE